MTGRCLMSGAAITNQLSCKQHANAASAASHFKNGLGGGQEHALWLAHCRQIATKAIRTVFLPLTGQKLKFGQIRGRGEKKGDMGGCMNEKLLPESCN